MSNNFTANPGSGGDTFAADDLGTYKIPYSKIDVGAAGFSSPVTAANPLPVSGAVSQSGAWTTGRTWSLTSVSDSITTVPSGTQAVSGTFWQATQPVSIASMPTTGVKPDGTVWAQTGTSANVNVTNSVPVTGTFWQATQPVSIATMPSTPVTGTFWQATQPVSLASMPTTSVKPDGTVWALTGTSANVNVSNSVAVTGTFWQATQPVSIAAAVTVSQATASSLNATVTQQPITKGTQGANGVTTQDLKDAGRVSKMFTVSGLAATATTETGPVTYTISSGLGATTTGTTYTVTTGKTLRVQQIIVSARNSTGTTASPATFRIRAATSGAITTSSPLQAVVVAGTPASAQSTYALANIPDGLEFPSASTLGFTIQQSNWVTASVVCTFDITVIGYEY